MTPPQCRSLFVVVSSVAVVGTRSILILCLAVAVVGVWIWICFISEQLLSTFHVPPQRSAAGIQASIQGKREVIATHEPHPPVIVQNRSKNTQRTNMKDNGRRHVVTSATDMGMDKDTDGPVAVASRADYSSFKSVPLREASSNGTSMMIRQPQPTNNERTPLIHSSSLSDNSVTESEHSRNEHHAAILAKQASKTIVLIRILVFSVMAASTAIAAATVFAVMKQAERDTFEESFKRSSASLVSSVGRSLYTTLGAVDTFVVGMVTFARHTHMEWPFVTLPDYAVQLAKIRARANLACVNQFTLIPANQRQEWESYAFHHDDWVEDGLRVQQNNVNFHGSTLSSKTSKVVKGHSIWGSNGPYPNQTKPYLVSWQSSPVMPMGHPYNVEFSTVYSNPAYRTEAIDHRKVILAEVYNVPATTTPTPVDDATTIASKSEEKLDDVSKYIAEYIQYLDPNRKPSEPMSDIIYPILRDAPNAVTADSSDTNSTAVGFLIATLFWTDLIRHVLPAGTNGIIFIMENECDQVFSYQIDGPEVTYLGPGDHHNPAYDHLKQETNFVDLAKSMDDPSSVIYSGLSFSDKGCPFHLRLYPSEDFESMFMSKDPFLYTMNVLILFGFMSCLFCTWDTCVERRQKIVMQRVLESSANVVSLEQRVQERTRRIRETNKRLEEANRRLEAASAAQLQTFASMSHEIRTPLNCVMGLSSLLMETNLNPSQAESMQMIASSSDLLLAVVNDILDFSKLESGNVEIEIRRTNLQEMLNSVVFAIETKAEDGNVGLRTHFGATVGSFMHTDGRRLQQILYNLLGNAVKFSTPGTNVELTLTMTEERCKAAVGYASGFYSPTDDETENEESSRVVWEGPSLCFSVKNYGNGIPLSDLKKIFKPFQQSMSTHAENSGGTGLGLAITTRLVHALQGRISVESCSGEWAMFSVEFPWSSTEPVDVQQMSQKVKTLAVSLVSQQTEVAEQLKGVFNSFSIHQSVFSTMTDLKQLLAGPSEGHEAVQKKHVICIVDEDLYDASIYAELCNSTVCLGISLVTFGPKHIGTDTQDHFRSLVRLIPSVLVEHLRSYISGDHTKRAPPRSASARAASITEAERLCYQRYRVLIAEDNVINQKVLVRMLKRLGLTHIDIVDNGQQAVDLEASKSFDVVFMDMSMPVMDGLEACERIVNRDTSDTHPKAKVFFVTAHAGVEFEGVCRKAGGAGFLPKPYNIRDIEKCFQRLHTLLEER